MKFTFKKTFIVLSALFLIFLITSCSGGGKEGFYYPNTPHTLNNGTPSWEQGDKSDLTIKWYVDRSSFYWAGKKNSDVSNMIYEKTGIKIEFIIPLNDDGTKLNTILNSDDMPDLITVSCSNTTRVQMQEEGYAYPLDELASRWAPTLFDNWTDEINYMFAASDGKLYGVPSLYYSEDDIEAFDDQGNILQANASFIVRSDYLEEYLNYASLNNLYDSYIGTVLDDYTIETSMQAAEYAVTKASNFILMCKWVKDNHPNIASTIVTDAFLSTEDNKGLYRLSQYFAVPREDSNGNLVIQEETEEFYECISFLNECYREGLISDSNFSNTKAQQGMIVQNGNCFCFMGCPQDYGTYTREFAKSKLVNSTTMGAQYVGIIITDDEGTAPVMNNLAGTGDTFTMISKDCKNPDRLIKLVDYLTSFEGQMLTYFGVEGEHWYYEIEPGQTIRDDRYVETTDTTFQAGTKYYEFNKVLGSTFYKNKTYYMLESGKFKKSYTIEFLNNTDYYEMKETTDSTMASNKKYYVLEEGPNRTYKYGRVMWYKEVFEDVASGRTSSGGFLTFQLLRPNKAIAKLATYSGDEMYHFSTYLTYNMKCVVSDYLYTAKLLGIANIRDSRVKIDDYLEITSIATMIQQKWRENLPTIITQQSEGACRNAYLVTKQTVQQMGSARVLRYDNAKFQQLKEKFGVERVWAPLVEGYNPPKVKSIYGNTSYKVEIPGFIVYK